MVLAAGAVEQGRVVDVQEHVKEQALIALSWQSVALVVGEEVEQGRVVAECVE